MVENKSSEGAPINALNNTLMTTIMGDLKQRKIPEKAKLFLYNDVLTTNQVIFCDNAEIKIDRPSFLVFVDHAPLLNWGHQCEYYLFDSGDAGLYRVIAASMPPKGFFHNPARFVSIGNPSKSTDPCSTGAQQTGAGSTEGSGTDELKHMIELVPGNRYAILISGMSEERHLNDLEYMYHTLITGYKFKPDNIRVLNLDGKCGFCTNPGTPNFSGTSNPVYRGGNQKYTLKIDGRATKANILASIRSPGLRLGPAVSSTGLILEPVGPSPWNIGDKDLLFIFVTNHGLNDGDAYVVCDDDHSSDDFSKYDTLGVPELTQAISAAPPVHALVVVMEQCFGGAFQDAVMRHGKARYKYFAAACGPCNSSVALDGTGLFDQFSYHLTMALSGLKPDDSTGDVNLGNDPTLRNAYAYALRKVQPVYDHGISYVDTPVSAELPKDAGKTMTLKEV